MPYDVALSLPPHTAAAYGIIFGELDGNRFDFARMRWEEPK